MNGAKNQVSDARRPLRTISEIRSFFRTNARPIFFVGPTAFNLLGIDRWVRNFRYLVYYDSWDGAHRRVFTPKNKPFVEFESSEQINNYLLRDREVQAHIASRVGAGARIAQATPDVLVSLYPAATVLSGPPSWGAAARSYVALRARVPQLIGRLIGCGHVPSDDRAPEQ